MAGQHTPGPWEAKLDEARPTTEEVWDVYAADDSEYASEGDLAIVASYCTEADAHLIAAAPALLEALERLVAACDVEMDDGDQRWVAQQPGRRWRDARDLAREALAAARAEEPST